MAFISQKITYGAACAKLGIRDSAALNERSEPMVRDGQLTLGNLEATRDWGCAGDTIRAMWLMLQQPTPDDFVIGSGVSRSVREMCEAAYGIVGLDWREHVASDPSFVRSPETVAAVADAAKARTQLGWAPAVSFRDMLADMVAAHLDRLRGH